MGKDGVQVVIQVMVGEVKEHSANGRLGSSAGIVNDDDGVMSSACSLRF